MNDIRRARTAILLLAGGLGAATVLAPLQGLAAEHRVTTVAFQFVPSVVTLRPGDTLTYTNADTAPHNVQSAASGPDGRPLFASDIASAGESAPVEGVDRLQPGSYPFLCILHPGMRGRVDVIETPPVPTPAGSVRQPTSIAIEGSTLYAASYMDDNVVALPILPGGMLGPSSVYASGFENPLGIAFGPDGTLYVADSHDSTRPGRDVDGRVWAIPPGGGPATTVGKIVIDLLPNGRHNTNGLAVHGNRLYIANGNSTDDGATGGDPEEPLSGTLLSVPLTARGLTPADLDPEPEEPDDPDDLLIEAYGMRNPYDVAFRPGTAEAWIPTNGPDRLDPFGEDLLHKASIPTRPPDFGFPACVYRSSPNGAEAGQNPAVAATKKCGPHTPPETLLGLHTSANGLAFGSGGAYWRNDLFIAQFGANGLGTAGHKIVRVPIDPAGRAGAPVDVITLPSPLDVTFGAAGLYVADFLTNSIVLLTASGT